MKTMSRLLLSTLIAGVLILIAVPVQPGYAKSGSENYRITRDVMSNGGHVATSGVYRNASTAAQPGAVSVIFSSRYRNQSGFWNTILATPPLPAASVVSMAVLMILLSIFIRLNRYRHKGANDA